MKEKIIRKKEKILVIPPYGIGNLILALPAIKLLNKIFSPENIDILAPLPTIYEIFKTFPDFKSLYNKIYLVSLKTSLWQNLKQIYKITSTRYDFSLLMFPSARIHYNIYNFITLAKKRIGSLYPDINFKRAHFLNNINIPVIIGIHDVYQNINLLKPFGIDYKKVKIKSNLSGEALKKKKKIIGIHPGAKREAFYKKWEISKYFGLIKTILKKYKNYRIRIFAGKDDEKEVNILKQIKSTRIEFIINQPLYKVFQKINECSIFISNDSGLMHLANFAGCYNIVIIGPSDFRRTGPFNKPYSLIYKNLPCQPCSHTYFVKSHKFKCPYNLKCLKLITEEDILKEIDRYINFKRTKN